ATALRQIRRASSSLSARWSVTPERRECISPPPSSSTLTSSPVAALTSGGPPRKIVPWSLTITFSSLIAGREAPPAVEGPGPSGVWGVAPGEAGGRCDKRLQGPQTVGGDTV